MCDLCIDFMNDSLMYTCTHSTYVHMYTQCQHLEDSNVIRWLTVTGTIEEHCWRLYTRSTFFMYVAACYSYLSPEPIYIYICIHRSLASKIAFLDKCPGLSIGLEKVHIVSRHTRLKFIYFVFQQKGAVDTTYMYIQVARINCVVQVCCNQNVIYIHLAASDHEWPCYRFTVRWMH